MNGFYDLSSLKGLLADTLREKPCGYVIEEIFARFPSVPELLDATEQELTGIKGVGKAKARQIVSAVQLAKMLTVRPAKPCVIRSPQDVWQLLAPEIAFLQKEHFVCLFLSIKNHVIAKETVSIGSLNAAIVHPREVFRAAIKRSAASVVCVHNHPSGDPTPSTEDVQLTERLAEAGIIVGIEVLDHIIVGHDRYCSLKEQGLL
ncbi:RadC family protein [Paenibacillus whitsoniae]|uniref:JAB domain-containing protein n=1 Tax=Paenibacillus whitsoniae TaxID=2496558 RepID=A0A430J4U3_9BACL|nr:DNA repair protein RadC [Paenibacillus whitsoniae]RTE01747.1 JAB domain-containing protein [Paenibacillus whitsoniae]